MKYTLHVIDLQSENSWDNKAVYLLYTELIMGKCILLFCLFAVINIMWTQKLVQMPTLYWGYLASINQISDTLQQSVEPYFCVMLNKWTF